MLHEEGFKPSFLLLRTNFKLYTLKLKMHFSRKFYLLILITLLIVCHSFTISAAGKREGPDQTEAAERKDLRPTPSAAVATVPRFQWVPSFNFVFRGRPAENDRYPVSGTIGLSSVPDAHHNSHELLRWHQEQIPELKRSYRAVSGRFGRNVAVVMLSLVYIQDDRLLIRNVPIPVLFLSGFAKDDSPIREAELLRKPVCVGELYRTAPIYPTYLADLQLLFRGTAQGTNYSSRSTTPSRREMERFQAEECHSERGIAVYLREVLLNDTLITRALFGGIDPRKGPIVALIVNIASYRDMCGSCQGTFVQELTHGHLFLNRLRDYWEHHFRFNKDFAIVIAQSGIEEYREEATRSSRAGFINSDERPIEFDTIKNCVIHMENK
jgi:hypothetical protein